ncbi:MAG: glycosyltransferase family 61 protein [Erythrobacter sp.]|jgi:hypothetical protein|nr:glycosyltransferase family 61 protein [Erythrobacter sp.]
MNPAADGPFESLNSFYHSALWHLRRMPERAVEAGVPPGLLGWKWRRRVPLGDYLARSANGERKEVIEPARRLSNPLPRNIDRREELSRDGALWGYSRYDVPTRESSESYIAHLNDATLLFHYTPDKRDFFPALVSHRDEAIECREISHRPLHAAQAAQGEAQLFPRATWFLERAYHNHSHWLTAHLPKLILLKEREDLPDILLPKEPSKVMLESIAMLGIPRERFRTFDPARPVAVGELALVGTDRFGPSRVRSVRSAFAGEGHEAQRKVFISRAASRGRKLLNEDVLWPMLEERGFERVLMERLSFREQVDLMRETRVLLAPHGAGLTNMIFMPEGGHVIEMADPGFPNPNFYALACALGLDYWLIDAGATAAEHPLDRDLFVEPGEIESVLERT